MDTDPGVLSLFGIFSIVVLFIAWKRGFFLKGSSVWNVPLRSKHLLFAFGTYFLVTGALLPFLVKHLFVSLSLSPPLFFSSINFFSSALIGSCLSLLFLGPFRPLFKALWKESSPQYSADLLSALFAWFTAFPIVLWVGGFFDWIALHLFHAKELPEQIAVRLLKMSFQSPVSLLLSVVTIVILAPLIEEFLFRGCLQTFIRQHLGSTQAVWVTSLLFAFFHYSPEQGLGNIPIIASLLVLAWFLGHLYEKQKSLLSPIFLHALFNLMNVLSLYFLGGFPKSPI